jgi:hypothetical protein
MRDSTQATHMPHWLFTRLSRGDAIRVPAQFDTNDTWRNVISIDETAIYLKRRKVSGFSKRGKKLQIEYEKGDCERLSLLPCSTTG